MAISRQSGSLSFTAATNQSVTVTSYVSTRAILICTARCDGSSVGNAWDNQVIARKVDSTHINFQREGTTGTITVYWQLIECTNGEFSVQNINDVGPLASTTNEDYSITWVPLSRSFTVVTANAQGDRDNNTSARFGIFDNTTARVSVGAAVDGTFEFYGQVVTMGPGTNPMSIGIVLDDVQGDVDQSITTVDASKSMIWCSAYKATSGVWDNAEIHSIRLAAAGNEIEMRREVQTGVPIDTLTWVVQADVLKVQRASKSLAASTTSSAQAFTAPDDSSQVFIKGGSYYNGSQFQGTSTNGPDSSSCTLVPNGAYDSVTVQRATSPDAIVVELEHIEFVPLTGIQFADLSYAQGTKTSPPSLAVNTSHKRKIAVVMVSDESTNQATAVTIGGVSCTKVVEATATAGLGNAQSMWALLNDDFPAGAGPHAVAVTGTGFDNDTPVECFYLHNADQVIPTGSRIATDVSNIAETTMTASATAPASRNSIGIGIASHGDLVSKPFNEPPTGGGNWVRTFYNPAVAGDMPVVGGNQKYTSGGSKTYTETASSSWNRATMLFAIFSEYVDPGPVIAYGINI